MEVGVRDLFENATVEGLGRKLEEELRKRERQEVPEIERADRSKALPLSFAQQRMWFIDQLMPQSEVYNIPVGIKLAGELDEAALDGSLRQIVKRHEAVRTVFRSRNGEPEQVITSGEEIRLSCANLREVMESQREQAAALAMKAEAGRAFDLSRGPLIRALIVRINEEERLLLICMHHIVSDGWSMGVFIDELSRNYEAQMKGSEAKEEELPIQYADYAVWQREWLRGEVLEREMEYWKRELEGIGGVLELVTDRPRPAVQSYKGATEVFRVARGIEEAIKAISREEGATLFMTMLAGFQILLNRYSGQEEICIGTPIANRKRAEIEKLIGFFVNMLVIRGKVREEEGFRGKIREVKEAAWEHTRIRMCNLRWWWSRCSRRGD